MKYDKSNKTEHDIKKDGLDESQPSGVFAVTTDYRIKYDPTDLSNVMKPDDALFIGTGYECACFIRDHKPPQPSGGKSAEEIKQIAEQRLSNAEWLDDKQKADTTFGFRIGYKAAMEEYASQYAHQQPVNDGWRVYNTGVDITEQCTFESGVITINRDVVKIKVNPDEPRCY